VKRSKAEIVRAVEQRLYKHIVDPKQCVEGCRCGTCFEKFLDNYLETSNTRTRHLLGQEETNVFRAIAGIGIDHDI